MVTERLQQSVQRKWRLTAQYACLYNMYIRYRYIYIHISPIYRYRYIIIYSVYTYDSHTHSLSWIWILLGCGMCWVKIWTHPLHGFWRQLPPATPAGARTRCHDAVLQSITFLQWIISLLSHFSKLEFCRLAEWNLILSWLLGLLLIYIYMYMYVCIWIWYFF